MIKFVILIFQGLFLLNCAGNLSTISSSSSGSVILINHRNADLLPSDVSVISGIKALDIYFEHASVGGNIMGGIRGLSTDNATYTLNLGAFYSTIDTNWFRKTNGLVENNRGNPGADQKIELFSSNMRTSGFAETVGLAMYKFCYIDTPSNPGLLFTNAMNSMEVLESNYPNVHFIWWTMPLQSAGSANNGIHSFNVLVRSYCALNNKPLFDLADIEAWDTNGSYLTNTSGRPYLAPIYTDDGGHLNAIGSKRAAIGLWNLFACFVK